MATIFQEPQLSRRTGPTQAGYRRSCTEPGDPALSYSSFYYYDFQFVSVFIVFVFSKSMYCSEYCCFFFVVFRIPLVGMMVSFEALQSLGCWGA